MPRQGWLAFVVVMIASVDTPPGRSCCPAPPSGKPVVNADQTVIIIWDAAAKTQHFIRKASFKSDADDFGFIIPSPSQPELAESDNGAFSLLQKLTEPETKRVKRPAGTGLRLCDVASVRTRRAGRPRRSRRRRKTRCRLQRDRARSQVRDGADWLVTRQRLRPFARGRGMGEALR